MHKNFTQNLQFSSQFFITFLVITHLNSFLHHKIILSTIFRKMNLAEREWQNAMKRKRRINIKIEHILA